MSKEKVLILGSQHGNEVLGINLYTYMSQKYPEYVEFVDYICANPDAYSKHTRFIETDMNRSYKMDGHSYEEDQAREILKVIKQKAYDYVLDVHTTTAGVGGVFVAVALNDANTKIIRASKITEIITMSDEIAEHSLIGHVPSSISIEYNEVLAREESSLEELSQFVINLIDGNSNEPLERHQYVVTGFIANDEDTAGFENFKLSHRGYYPLLFGEANYTKYRGFKAETKVSQII
jgi:succinylglutamate desuccinylase